MNSRDVVGLYEAYQTICEGSDKKEYDFFGRVKGGGIPEPGSYYDRAYKANMAALEKLDAKKKNKNVNEEVDVYDLVLDYLLDEGYCDDVESAEVIMANMSEEWLDEIVEGFVSPYKTRPTYGNPQGTSPAMKALKKSDDLQKTELGSERQKKQTRRSQQLNRIFQAARQGA